jgi:alpha-L-rhamnosidase
LREDDPHLARCGPYFWTYLLPLLARHDLHGYALQEIRRLWGRMLDEGASTLWETFSGDELDTWCHPWSAAPLEFLMTSILGLDPLSLGGLHPILRPRTDLLPRAEGRIFVSKGEVRISWDTDARGRPRLAGRLPEGVTAILQRPDGEDLATVSGVWSHQGRHK